MRNSVESENNNFIIKCKQNVINYLVFFGILLFYVLFTLLIQTSFGYSAIKSNTISNLFMILFCGILYFRHKKQHDIGFDNCLNLTTKNIIGCSTYFVIVTCIIQYGFLWCNYNIVDNGMVQRTHSFGEMTILIYFLYSCVLSPVTEEIVMRMYLYNKLKSSSHWIIAMVISSVCFALLHGTLAHIFLAFMFSIAITLVYEYTGSGCIVVVFHMLYNFIALFFKVSEGFVLTSLMIFCMVLLLCSFILFIILIQKLNKSVHI